MDAIARAMQKKLHISNDYILNQQKWSDFDKTIVNKKIFIIGVGVASDYFFKMYEHKYVIEGVIDNDVKKQGHLVSDFQVEAFEKEIGNIRISDMKVLDNYDVDEIVILISSTNYYMEIINQLQEKGIFSSYVLLIMEANERKMSNSSVEVLDEVNEKKRFVEECLNRKIFDNKVVFNMDSYGGHGKAITEQLLKMRGDLDIVWMVKDISVEVPKGVRTIFIGNWKKFIYEIETAKIWVWDLFLPRYIVKRESQFYIQTKHWASVTLKKFALEDKIAVQDENLVSEYKYNSEMMDYIIVGSDFDEASCRSGFGFNKEFIRAGSPRSDVLFSEKINRQKVYEYFNLNKEYHTLLYAPTFRYDLSENDIAISKNMGIDLEVERIKKALETKFGGEWRVLLRLHPFVAKQSSMFKLPEYVVDASGYEDSELLVSASDILITDYSSIMFEAAFVKKAVFLLAVDRKEYIGKERDLLIDYDMLPFSIAETNEELVANIWQFNYEDYVAGVADFLDKYGVHEDGHASERAAEFILELIDDCE